MNTNNQVVMVPAGKLKPHPKNPRKDLGDLTELSDSIKKNGIMQNLTAVPDPEDKDSYKIIIGHRRFAAGQKAGLEEFPVVIRDLDEAEQIRTMLCENIQRNDLTVIEQAQGFQMMMDFGITVDDLAKDTGFAKSTIYHRLNIAKLDENELVKKMDQLTITDLIELEKIEDEELRNKLLKDADNGSELRRSVRYSYEEQERRKIEKVIRERLLKEGLKEKEKNSWDSKVGEKYVERMTTDTDPEGIKIKKKGVAFTHFWIDRYGTLLLYTLKKNDKKVEKSDEEKRMDEIEKRVKALYGEINEAGHQLSEQIRIFLEDAEDNEKDFSHDVKEELLCETLLYLAIDQPSFYQFQALNLSDKGVKSTWNYGQEDKERYDKHYKEAKHVLMKAGETSPIKCASLFLRAIASCAADGNKLTNSVGSWRYDDTIKTQSAYEMRTVIRIISKLGFKLDEDMDSILQGKGPAFDEIEELKAEYDSLRGGE